MVKAAVTVSISIVDFPAVGWVLTCIPFGVWCVAGGYASMFSHYYLCIRSFVNDGIVQVVEDTHLKVTQDTNQALVKVEVNMVANTVVNTRRLISYL